MRATLFALMGALVLGVGCTPEQKAPEPPPPAPQIESFTVTPATVSAGEKVKVEWKTVDATSVELQQAGKGVVSGAEELSGSVEVTVQEDALFVLTAKNARGVSESRAATVDVLEAPDEVLFVATPEEVGAGQPATLAWSANGAREVSLATGDGTAIDLGGQKATGAVTVAPIATTQYVLTVDGKEWEASVRVRPVVNAFVASPASANPGEALALSWKTTGATQVKVSLAGAGELLTETDPAKVADGTLSFTVPAELGPAAALSFRLVASNEDGATTTSSLTAYVTGAPKLREVVVPSYARAGGSFEVTWKSTGADGLEVVQDGTVVYVAPDLATIDAGKVMLFTKPQDTVVRVRAISSRGGLDESDAFTVNPVGVPTIDQFDVTPTTITNGGEPVTITWNVPSARHLTIAAKDQFAVHSVDGLQAETGSLSVYPNKLTEYVITVDNGIGDVVSQTSPVVSVTNPATVVFSVATAPAGAPISITGTTAVGGGDLTGLPFINAGTDAFVDIASAANDTNFGSGWYTSAQEFTLPQPYVGLIGGAPVNASHLSISPNGWFVFMDGSENGPNGPSAATLEGDLPPQAVAPLFADMRSDSSSAVYAQVDSVNGEQRLIVQWNDFIHESFSGSRLTFQAQVYASGRVVFAYQTLSGLGSYDVRTGVVHADGNGSDGNSTAPFAGDAIGWGTTVTPPVAYRASATPFSVIVALQGGGFLRIDDVTYPVLPPDEFEITEANFFPAAGHGEWFEVANMTSTPIDLNGWTINFGSGGTHTIASPLLIPANGRVLLGQDADAAEASAGGPAVDYVYGPSYLMDDGAGSVSLELYGATYAQLSWPAGAPQGVAWEPYVYGPGETWVSGSTPSCPSSPYGSGIQSGTPGVAGSNCYPYRMSVDTNNPFVSIATSPGSQVAGALAGSSGTDTRNETITLARPITYFGNTYSTLWVSSNGFLGVIDPTSTYTTNNTTLSTSNPNGVLSPFWDDLVGNTGGAVLWQQFDPDATPNSGDEYTIVSYEDWKRYGYTGSLNFQVVFFEGSGDIEFRYGTMTSADTNGEYAKGSSATTWLEDPNGTSALVYNVNSVSNPGITPNTTIHFTAQ